MDANEEVNRGLYLLLKKMTKHILAVGEYENRVKDGLTLSSDNKDFDITITIKAKNGPITPTRVS